MCSELDYFRGEEVVENARVDQELLRQLMLSVQSR